MKKLVFALATLSLLATETVAQGLGDWRNRPQPLPGAAPSTPQTNPQRPQRRPDGGQPQRPSPAPQPPVVRQPPPRPPVVVQPRFQPPPAQPQLPRGPRGPGYGGPGYDRPYYPPPRPAYRPGPPVYAPPVVIVPGPSYGPPPGWRHRRPYGWCQAKAQRLYQFEYTMQQDGYVSKDEARIARALRADLANSCGGGRWAPNRGWYYG